MEIQLRTAGWEIPNSLPKPLMNDRPFPGFEPFILFPDCAGAGFPVYVELYVAFFP